jgi:protein-disulfide isomerase
MRRLRHETIFGAPYSPSAFALTAAVSATVAKRFLVAGHPTTKNLPVELSVAATDVIGYGRDFLGDASSQNTLVEFMDYDCSPCRSVFPKVEAIVRQHKGQLRLSVRHYPLEIHPHAREAAIFAESARSKGKFWILHRRLLEEKAALTPERLSEIAAESGLTDEHLRANHKEAAARVSQDEAAVKRLKIDSTPTFLLCTADGRVYRLRNLDHVSSLLK